jgi:hypothetical protein
LGLNTIDITTDLLKDKEKTTKYCSTSNRLESFSSIGNELYLTYNKYNNSKQFLMFNEAAAATGDSRVDHFNFELSYFSYPYLFTDKSMSSSMRNGIDIKFNELIPTQVPNQLKVDDLKFKIKLPHTFYLKAIVKVCFNLKSGVVKLRADDLTFRLPNKCADPTSNYSSIGVTSSMLNEMTIELESVNLAELRDSNAWLNLNYQSLPTVFKEDRATFETIRFADNNENLNLLSKKDHLNVFEWLIDVEENKFIYLTIEDLVNNGKIDQITIIDEETAIQKYEMNEIIENYNSSKRSYLFAANKLRIIFQYRTNYDATSVSNQLNEPYIRISYKTQNRIIDIKENNEDKNVLHLPELQTREKLSWLLVAPRDYIISAFIVKTGQNKRTDRKLIFSLLNTGYSDAGEHYLNLKDESNETNVIVSKDNQMKIVYYNMNVDVTHPFKVSIYYELRKRVLIEPIGTIDPIYNHKLPIDQVIKVTNPTDQRWTLRAPYNKRISIFTAFTDLMHEEKCSKSFVKFFNVHNNDKNELIISKCSEERHSDLIPDRQIYDSLNLYKEKAFLLNSTHNQLNVNFVTQDDNAVSVRSSNGRPYEGFQFVYKFIEQPGDCYFTDRSYPFNMCGYENISPNLEWAIEEPNNKDKSFFNSLFCSNCFLTSGLPFRMENESEEKLSALLSPKISSSQRYVKFTYKYSTKDDTKAYFEVRFISSKRLDLYKTELSTLDGIYKHTNIIEQMKPTRTQSSEWQTVQAEIEPLMNDYHLIFVLRAQGDAGYVKCAINNIVLFDYDSHCGVPRDDQMCDNYFYKETQIKSGENQYLHSITPCHQNGCQNGAICQNEMDTQKQYSCLCSNGFEGEFCEKRIDYCSVHINDIKCSNHSKCESTTGSDYTCRCDGQYYGDYCEQIVDGCKIADNPCNRNTNRGVCINNSTIDNPKGFKCECYPQYTGDNCEIKLEKICDYEKCRRFDKEATCSAPSLDGKTKCSCSAGFEGDYCENINDCSDDICVNGGVCVDGINSFKCECGEGFGGKFCEICNKCIANNTLTCDNGECVCKSSHRGEKCEEALDICERGNKCQNDGKCVSLFETMETQYKCHCSNGYTGLDCETKIEETQKCDSIKCLNGGVCSLIQNDNSTSTSIECKCPNGYTGQRCENLKDLCKTEDGSNLCQKNGKCHTIDNDQILCACPISHTGMFY